MEPSGLSHRASLGWDVKLQVLASIAHESTLPLQGKGNLSSQTEDFTPLLAQVPFKGSNPQNAKEPATKGVRYLGLCRY